MPVKSDKIEIYPKQRPCFYAIKFTGEHTDEFVEAMLDLGLAIVSADEESHWIEVEGESTKHPIKPSQYFVRCGPYWDIMTSTEIMDEFVIG